MKQMHLEMESTGDELEIIVAFTDHNNITRRLAVNLRIENDKPRRSAAL